MKQTQKLDSLISRIIKEELLNVLEVQDPTVVKQYPPKPTKNMATNPEVRTKPQSGNVPSISKRDFKIDPSS